jgi:transglutaminase-like putative cysteine protease
MAHLLPRPTPSQVVLSAEVRITPEPDEREESTDIFGNRVLRFAIHRNHSSLEVEAISEVVHSPRLFNGEHPTWESIAELIASQAGTVAAEVAPFAADSRLAAIVPELDELTGPVFTPGRSIVDVVIDLCHTINREFQFDAGFSDITTPVSAVLAARRGVCQDFAHVAVAALRSKGLAGRYISGYIETRPPPGQQRLVGVDASHAWAAAWFPAFGWLEFDPTNDQIPPRNHVTVGWGRDYGDVAPVRGVVISAGGNQQLDVAVDVMRLADPD